MTKKLIDETLIPTYEGGCPSRYVKLDGYDNCAGQLADSYDPLINRRRAISPNVHKLIKQIRKRKNNYGKLALDNE